MTATNTPSEKVSGTAGRLLGGPLWTRLRCSRCRYVVEHPGSVSVGDLDEQWCPKCRRRWRR